MKGTELADHIRDEMAKAGHDYIDMLGELMTEYLRRHPETEIDGKLTLKGAYDALRERAKKKAKAGCYAMPPEVEQELERLRKLEKSGANENVLKLRVTYTQTVEMLGKVESMIRALEDEQPDEALRYRRAVAAAAMKIAERLGGAE